MSLGVTDMCNAALAVMYKVKRCKNNVVDDVLLMATAVCTV